MIMIMTFNDSIYVHSQRSCCANKAFEHFAFTGLVH